MVRARDILERLRPVGAPGAAGPAGVPADRLAGVAAELEPVFAALEQVQARARQVRATARAEAAARADRAVEQAQEIVAQARRDAEAERADASARLLRQADTEAGEELAAAVREATEIGERAALRLPGLVAAVVDRADADLRDRLGGHR